MSEYQQQEAYLNRLTTLQQLPTVGIDPYPYDFAPTASIEAVLKKHHDDPLQTSEEALVSQQPIYVVAGRLTLLRLMGKNAFGQLQEQGHALQIMLNKEHTHVKGLSPDINGLKFLEKKLDLGDIVGVTGILFRTHKGELTLFVQELVLLSKSLLPLPEKHLGLIDKEIRYRKRWLDMISHTDVMHTFKQRSFILQQIRLFLWEEGFTEVETPILQNTYGGAQATPFTSHIDAINQDVFLRISLEIPLKKLIIGGMSKIFEIGKVFRNEGIDRTHNPEFTLLEAYATYCDYETMMDLVERLVEAMVIKIHHSTLLPYQDQDQTKFIDVKRPWKRITMHESVEQALGIQLESYSLQQLKEYVLATTPCDPQTVHSATKGSLVALLFDAHVADHLIQPTHIIDHPIETTPLCKPHRTKASQGIVERFETFVLGKELCNAYTELNDPILQRTLLEQQVSLGYPLDEDFLEAISQGMPPTAGIGIGLDRLVMLLTQSLSIRDVVFFPIMKPKE